MDSLHWWLLGTGAAGWFLAFGWWRTAERGNLPLAEATARLLKEQK